MAGHRGGGRQLREGVRISHKPPMFDVLTIFQTQNQVLNLLLLFSLSFISNTSMRTFLICAKMPTSESFVRAS